MSDNRENVVGGRNYSRIMISPTSAPAVLPHAVLPHAVLPHTVPTHAVPARATPALRRLHSPIGRIELVGDGTAVVSLTIERDRTLPHDGVDEHSDAILDRAADQLAQYFAGTRTTFDIPIALNGTKFQRSIWALLGDLKFGEVTSYGDLGLTTGRLSAGRAVGGAVGANPIPILVPCHRVLATHGRITGYSAGNGIPTKVWLLDHEGIGHRL
jgi:methylated-DNA-[protein]-cysteine S-methyltransferase